MASKLEEVLQCETYDWASSRFVSSVVQSLQNDRARLGEPRASLYAQIVGEPEDELRRLVIALRGSLVCSPDDPAEHTPDAEWCRRSPEFCGSDHLDRQLRGRIPALAEDLAVQVPAEFLTNRQVEFAPESVVREPVLSLEDLLRKAAQELIAAEIPRIDDGFVMDADELLFPTCQKLSQVCDSAAIRIPGCGFCRRRFLVDDPRSGWDNRPPIPRQFTLIPGPVDETVLWWEGERFSLAQLAHRLSQGRPEIVEAAKRLRTRIDIAWTDLPPVCPEDA
jgi:hypothetical protein